MSAFFFLKETFLALALVEILYCLSIVVKHLLHRNSLRLRPHAAEILSLVLPLLVDIGSDIFNF